MLKANSLRWAVFSDEMDKMGAFPDDRPCSDAALLCRARSKHPPMVECGVLPAVRRHSDAKYDRRHCGKVKAHGTSGAADKRNVVFSKRTQLPFRKAKRKTTTSVVVFLGGDKRDRTADLLTASQALSRLVRLHTPLNRVKRALQYAGNPKTHPECLSL